ncbi:hypothetical protein EOI86_21695 [Hwanghaeella grinnelliae]|uniref:Peptidase C14 caspase domain-containing protein n=1 Tax=Hwanghaeella grinnelliae TaxID=2500179 RepID=A0A3S2XZZ5_9PROT|nr:caspase family protein [Hwanghaeella grinnelliae]RVU33761.1 hypothetical protein EOI86_21695 [Hwanghaeella grinnelliae]
MHRKPVWSGAARAVIWAASAVITAAVASISWADELPDLSTDPILVLNGVGHTASVNRVLVSRDGARVFTVSDDQSLRVWRLDDGTLLDVVRGPIGPSDEGALYAVAESERFLAVAGRAGWDWKGGKTFVRVLSAADLTPKGVLTGLPSPVDDLEFSDDGKFLAVGLSGGGAGIRVFQLGRGDPVIKDSDYPEGVVDIAFLPDGRLLALGASGVLRAYNVANGTTVADVALPGTGRPWRLVPAHGTDLVAITHRASAELLLIPTTNKARQGRIAIDGTAGSGVANAAWGKGDKRVYAVSDQEGVRRNGSVATQQLIRSLDIDGKQLAAFDLQLTGVDAPIVDFVSVPSDGGRDALVFSTSAGDWGVLDVQGDGRLELRFLVRAEGASFRGGSARRPLINEDGTSVAFYPGASADRRILFDSKRALLEEAPDGLRGFFEASRTVGNHILDLDVELASARVDGRVVDLEPGERALDIVSSQTGDEVYLGSNHYLRRLAPGSGSEVWRVPVPAPAWIVAPSANGSVVTAFLGNGIIQWRSAADGRLLKSFFATRDTRHWVSWTPDGFFDHSAAALNKSGGASSGAQLIGYHRNKGYKDAPEFLPIDRLYTKYYRPDLVAYALDPEIPDLAASSGTGQSLSIAEVIDRNVPPPIEIIEACGVNELGGAAGCITPEPVEAVSGTRSTATRTVRAALPEHMRNRSVLEIILKIEDRGSGFGKIEIRRNGAQMTLRREGLREQENAFLMRYRIPLLSGTNTISVSVYDRENLVQSEPLTLVVEGDSGVTVTDKTIRVFAVGVSDYAVDMFDLQKGIASNDAYGIADAFADTVKKGGLYARSQTTVLVDENATKANILKGLRMLADESKTVDTVVVFFSGHGDAVDGNYVFAPHDLGAGGSEALAQASAGQRFGDSVVRDLFRTEGLSQAEIMSELGKIESENLILILDTCYAGSFQALNQDQRQVMSRSVVERVAHDSGRFILASARGLAHDSDGKDYPPGQGHGLFTSNALDGLHGEADFDDDKVVYLTELGGYVRREVEKESKGTEVPQVPVIKFYGDPFFPLAVTGEQATAPSAN